MSLPEETARLVKEAAEEAGLSVSAWLARAAEREIDYQEAAAEVEAHVDSLDVPQDIRDEAVAIHRRLRARSHRRAQREAS